MSHIREEDLEDVSEFCSESTVSSSVVERGAPHELDVDEGASEPTRVQAAEQRLGRYRLCFEVARGGMATVFLARAEGPAGFGRFVALKRIHAHLAKERHFVEMFFDEARIASMLTHPNTCPVTDFGEADGTYFLTMDYLVGESFARVLHALRTTNPRDFDAVAFVCRVVADASEGLHAAHELRGATGEPLHVVHRDVSPHNLFMTFEGQVKVVDFGIASAAGRLHHTSTGTVKGKFAYMAPEQLEGRAVDRRADVWSLGVVLWEALTGRRLFRRPSDSATILAVVDGKIPRVTDVRSDLDPELARIAARALERSPDARYASARELARDLSLYLGAKRAHVDLSAMAEHMSRLFPGALRQREQLLRVAAQIGDGAVVPVLGSRRESTGSTEQHVAPRARASSSRMARAAAVSLVLTLGAALALIATRTSAPLSPDEHRTSPGTALVASKGPPPAAPAIAPAEAPAPPAASAPSVASEPPPVVAEPPVETRAPVVVRRGTVNVTTPGAWADVYYGGRKLGQTPGQFSIPEGRQVLTVRPFGGPTSQRVGVRVVAGGVVRVRVDVAR